MATTDVVYSTELTNAIATPPIKPAEQWPGRKCVLIASRTLVATDREIHMVRLEPGDIMLGVSCTWEAAGANSTFSIGDVPTGTGSASCARFVAAFRTDVASDTTGFACSSLLKHAGHLYSVPAETDVVLRVGTDGVTLTAGAVMKLQVEVQRPGS